MSLRQPHTSSSAKIHYGWIIVLTGFLVLFACFGLARYAYAMLLPAMQGGLQLSYDQTGYIGTGNFIGYLLSVLLVPFALRRIKPRTAITCGLLLISLSLLAISQCNAFWQVFYLYTLAGIGGGFANIPLMLLIAYWFNRTKRGRALGLALGGNGAGIVLAGLLIPYLNQSFGAAGWRIGWLTLGGICLGVTVIAGTLLRNSPLELGLEPIGEPENSQAGQFTNHERTGDASLLVRLGLIYAAFGATFMIYGTFLVTTMVREYGFSEATAGFYWSWVGLFSLFSGVIFGGLSDRIGRKWGLVLVLLIQTIAYLLVGLKLGGVCLVASIILYGSAVFAIPAIMTAAIAEYLGLARAAASFATVTLFFAGGQSIGPAAAGLLARSSGGFSTAYLLAASLTLLGGMVALSLPQLNPLPDSCGQR
jgi:sugar phosphate permease